MDRCLREYQLQALFPSLPVGHDKPQKIVEVATVIRHLKVAELVGDDVVNRVDRRPTSSGFNSSRPPGDIEPQRVVISCSRSSIGWNREGWAKRARLISRRRRNWSLARSRYQSVTRRSIAVVSSNPTPSTWMKPRNIRTCRVSPGCTLRRY